MRVLSLTQLFPRSGQPLNGIFLGSRIAALARVEGVELRILVPVPWFPWKSEFFGRYAQHARTPAAGEWQGIPVKYPRIPVLPAVGMDLAPLLASAALIRPLMELRRTFDFDVIDSYYLYPEGVAASLLSAFFQRPFVMTALGSDVNVLTQYRVPRAWILGALRRAEAATTVSQALKDSLVGLGADPTQIRTIRHGVDLALFRLPENREAVRAQLSLRQPTLVSVGHLIEPKGHDVAIRAMTALPGMTLLIVGEGPEEGRLRRLIDDLHLQDRVRLLGVFDQSALGSILGAADLLVHCSAREGIPNVLLEAMACGTPVVAARVGGIAEVVRDPAAGLLLEERTPIAVAVGVRRLLEDPSDRAETRRVAERFSWADTAKEHMAALRAAIAGYEGRSAIVPVTGVAHKGARQGIHHL